MYNDPSEPFDSCTSELIKRKALKLSCHPAFHASDADDLEQELALHLLKRRSKYDPRRGSFHTFANRVLANQSINLISQRTAGRRDVRRERSLDAEFGVGLPEPEDLTRRWNAAIDMQRATALLPLDLKVIADELRQSSPAKARQDLNLTRGQFRHRVGCIAKQLMTMGLHPVQKVSNQRSRQTGM